MTLSSRAARAILASATLLVSLIPALAAPLTDKSLAPDWSTASQADKDAWIAAYKFEKADADKAGVVKCLDDYAGKPLFATNALSGVTGMCEAIAALPH